MKTRVSLRYFVNDCRLPKTVFGICANGMVYRVQRL